MPENITPEEEKEFRLWRIRNGYNKFSVSGLSWIKGLASEIIYYDDLYAIFKKESEEVNKKENGTY
jgi:hypothetical protein